MATGSLPASSSARSDQQRYIERQINATRRQVKLVELCVAGVTLVVGVLAFFLVAALIDHWVLPLSMWGRGLLLLVLLAGVVWYVITVLVPLLRHSINPAYAALAIEHSAPTLKNSLINFLMLRSERGQVHDVVYEAVEQRAAADLQQVPLDSVIDYSKLIKVGYVLAALFAVCAAYKVLSPKDPLQTAARVAAPWAQIARPSRVQIESVTPGDAQQFFGDSVTISAALRGVRASDRVALVFSSADGQVVDQSIDLTPADNGTTFSAALPAAGKGLQQDLTYRIEAGDAISRDYRLTVVAAPTIMVEKVDYDFPRYTQKPRETRERSGEVRALEGTRVTLHAKANQPIHTAYIEFDPTEGASETKRQRVQMQSSSDTATGTFVLELEADRVTPKHGSYQLTFMTESGHPGQQPAIHTIDVIRDLAPEVEVLTPKEQMVEVPENGAALVEVRAVDPDFALSRVGIKLTTSGQEFADKSLLDNSQTPPGQVMTKFQFRPQDYKLKAGTEVAWWATVADNRTAPATGLAEPNTARTKNFFFKVVAANPAAERQPGDGQNDQPMQGNQPMQNDAQPPQENKQDPLGNDGTGDMPMPNEQNPEEKKQDEEQPMENMGKQEEKNSDSSDQQQGGKSDMPMSGSQSQQSEGGGAGQSGGKSDGKSDMPMSEQPGGQQQDQSGGANGGNSDAQGNPSEKPEDAGNNREQKSDGASGKQEGASGKQPGAGQRGGESTGGKSDGAGAKPEQGGNENMPPGEREKPHDGEAFEQAIKHMLKQAQQQDKKDQGAQGQPKSDQGNRNGPQPTQDDFNKLSPELKDKLKDLMKKHQEQGGDQQKTDQAPPGVQGEKPAGGAKQDGEKKSGAGQQGAKPDGQNQPGAGEQSEQPMPGGADQGSDKKQGSGANNERGMGETGKPDETAKTKPEKPSASSEPNSDEKRQGGLGNNGQAGAGQASKDKSGAAQAQEANRDKPKSQQSGEQPPSEDQQAQSPSGSKKQSDSQGGESGDRSGGGKKGPGQSAKAAGNDAAGSNSAADEGAGAAKESGEGETGTGAGNKRKAEGKTGKSGDEAGEGSETKKSEQGDRSGEGTQGQSEESPMPAGEAEGDGGKTGDFVTGGGKPSDSTGRSKFADAQGPAAEKARLDYAKNATDLVLEYLKDQKDNPDQELLDDLGWSKDDLQRFLARWADAKREAADNPQAQRDLDESLRSLGLRAGQDKVRRAEVRNDNNRGLGDVGPTSGPPAKYLDQFRAFKKGAARAK